MTRAELICWATMCCLLLVATVALFTLGALIRNIALIGALFIDMIVGTGVHL